jgi:hypothetical protein
LFISAVTAYMKISQTISWITQGPGSVKKGGIEKEEFT